MVWAEQGLDGAAHGWFNAVMTQGLGSEQNIFTEAEVPCNDRRIAAVIGLHVTCYK